MGETMQVIPYTRENAILYARRWALSRNPAYYAFDAIGGDCTNFISQCIYAGAGVMNDTPIVGWYYRSVNDRAPAWTSVEYLFEFLVNNHSIGPFGHSATILEMIPGDVIQLGTENGLFYHSLLVTERYPEILVAAHSSDSMNRPLSSYDYANVRYIHIDGVRIS